MRGWACFSGRRAGHKVFVFCSVRAIKSSGTSALDLLREHVMAILPLSVQVQREGGVGEERKGEKEKSNEVTLKNTF